MALAPTQYARSGDADIAAGSGISFVERGEQEPKGVPDHWTLHAAAG